MGMVKEKGSATTNLVGKKSTAWVIGLLARAQNNGFDVDSLTVVDWKTLDPVYDASNIEMQYLGGVSIALKIEGGSGNKRKSEPVMWREGDEIGHWSTEKWRVGWDELKPTLLEERGPTLEPMARKQKLLEQIAQNRSSKETPEDIRILLEEKREAFAVCDQELSVTSEVEMDVDPGDHPPIKLKATPVPLTMRVEGNAE
uniref:Retrotransposon protein, putative, unclassified n=1 Tax=Haemonchus contortus TaxID=6289 RepID=A0A7I4Z693_HAECO